MDADSGPTVRPVRHGSLGGAVEPANRAAVAKQQFQTPPEAAGTRYELRDPFAEVTYRVKTFDDMVAKADQLGATRFHAVDADGNRTPVEKVGGAWPPAEARSAAMPAPTKEDAQRAADVLPLAAAAARVIPPEASIANVTKSAKIDMDAERAARALQLVDALSERYIIKRPPLKLGEVGVGHTEYRYRGDTSRIAFTETTFKLATDNNNPSVARSMVDVAESRNWRALRVSGNEDFKRLIWLEASLRGVKALGYEPQHADQELLRRERESRSINRIEPVMSAGDASADGAAKQSARGGGGRGGRKAVLAALEAVLISKHVPEKQRQAVMTAAAENLAQRLREGQTVRVKVYDKAAPSQRPVVVPTPEVQRNRERAAPAR